MDKQSKLDKYFIKSKKTLMKERNWTVLVFLTIFFGMWGFDRFYMGRVGTGIIKLFTFGGFGFFALYDWFLVFTNTMKDNNGMHAVK